MTRITIDADLERKLLGFSRNSSFVIKRAVLSRQ